jgi:carbon-monoxide dehydrogenase small subunit
MKSSSMNVKIKLNGKSVTLAGLPFTRLLDALREHGLTGTKEGCGEGECGACSVHVNGKLVNSCLIPIASMDGAEINTIESVACKDGALNKLQAAFWECGGAQCGICTPGMIMAAESLLKKNPRPNEAEIREGLAGNLCRCTGFTKIIDAVKQAAEAMHP